jgi:hypothetical protein
MRLFAGAVTIVLLTGPACAQGLNMNLLNEKPAQTEEELEKERAIDRAYKSAIEKVPTKKTEADPWGNMRSSGAAPANQPKPLPSSKPASTR